METAYKQLCELRITSYELRRIHENGRGENGRGENLSGEKPMSPTFSLSEM